MIVLNEASSARKYTCPYCSYRGTKEQLVSHVEKNHQSMIPEGYTAARVVFNKMNNKEHGTCVVCGKETQWNERTWKYDRVCGDPRCKEKLRQQYQANMKSRYGTDNIAKDPEHQKKMLAGRSISGEYVFSDGGKVSYTGTYELERLKFMDTVMEYKSWEIISPGPVIEYEFEGETHQWITDCYIVSANLVIDDKDGGDNPNNREMDSYRRKQLAKEKAIKDQGKYNYLRLTNKNFGQLLYALADIKASMIDIDAKGGVNMTKQYINEDASAAIAGAFPPAAATGYIITPCMMNNSFADGGGQMYIGLSKGTSGKMLYRNNNGVLAKMDTKEMLTKSKNKSYRVKADTDKIFRVFEAYRDQEVVGEFFLVETLIGKKVYDLDQLDFEPALEAVNIEQENEYIRSIEEATLRAEANKCLNHTDFSVDVFKEEDLEYSDVLLKNYSNLRVRQDPRGYFVENMINKRRTMSYESIQKIPRKLLKFI